MFSSTLRSVATMRGISCAVSPRSTGRSARSGSGASCRLAVKARSLAAPTSGTSSTNTLDSRSHFASLTGTRTPTRTLPSSCKSMRRTRPIGKPANVRSVPMPTPSALSVIRIRLCVASKTPRANST